jgi:polyhydroxyalkanoate synthesis regulator phasin
MEQQVQQVVSKGDLYVWDKCPYRKWSQLHGEHKEEKKASSKEIFLRLLNGEKVVPSSLEEALEVAELKKAAREADLPSLLREEDEIARGKLFQVELPNGIILAAKPDLVTYTDVDGHPYLKIYSFKTGDGLSRKRDFESLIYAYAVSKEYGDKVDVLVVKRNVRNGLVFVDEFLLDEIEDAGEILADVAQKYVSDMQSEEPPQAIPGPHCVQCPLLQKCPAGRGEAESIQEKMLMAEWAKELHSSLDKEIKEWAKELRDKLLKEGKLTEEEETAIAEFFGGRYKIVSRVRSSWRLATRKIKKSELPLILAQKGLLERFSDRLDVKIDDEVAEALTKSGVPLKKVATKTISMERG